MTNGFYLNTDGKYKDIESGEELEVKEVEHSNYGLIKYLFYNDKNHAVEWTPSEEIKELPEDWIDEVI